MSSAASLLIVREHAEQARDRARAEAQRQEAQQAAAQQQLQQLTDYRVDSDRRYTEQARSQGNIEVMRFHQGFMQRLNQAIDQQTRAVQIAAQRAQAAREQWQQAELHLASIGKLIERREAEALRVAGRREQRQTDEQATRAAVSRGGSTLAFAADRG